MTAIAIQPPQDAPGLFTRARWAVSDTLTISRRNLLVWARVPAYIMFTIIQPVMFVLLFRYVFGGAIAVHTKGGYVNFLMPGILAQTAAFACFGTAISLAQELQKGVIDRFRSMPMARSAVLRGRLVADTARMTVTILIVVGVGVRGRLPVQQRRRPRHRHGRAGHRARHRHAAASPPTPGWPSGTKSRCRRSA